MSIGTENYPNSQRRSLFSGFRDRTVWSLGLTQTIGYGTLYYAYGVVADAIAKDFSLGIDWIFAAFTIGLVSSGFAAPRIGHVIDERGARPVLITGSILAAIFLAVAASATGFWFFAVAVICIQVSSAFCLYDAAFAALTQIHGRNARPSITLITLIAGFASTVFWPLTQFLTLSVGWRDCFFLFALMHLAICLPLHFLMLRDAKPLRKEIPVTASQTATDNSRFLEGAERQRALTIFVFVVCLSGFAYASLPVHMLRIIEKAGFSGQDASYIAMIMGPAQVIARVLEILAGRRFDALVTAKTALASLLAAITALLLFPGTTVAALLFAALFGVSQGLITIARGTVPLQLFGPHGFGSLIGNITRIRVVISAASPFLLSLALTSFGEQGGLVALLILTLLAGFSVLRLRKPTQPTFHPTSRTQFET